MDHASRLRAACLAQDAAAPEAAQGKFRQRFHFSAPSGWINDPNGCVWYRGAYHIFYQHNPYAPEWGAMHWGHATSADLVRWRHEPVALAPSEAYDDHHGGGVFSGSTIAAPDGGLAALYTGVAATPEGGMAQTQCLAVSGDGGRVFTKYPGNPVIRALPPGVVRDFRDPRLLRHNGVYYAVVGASLGEGESADGCVALYRSADLRNWEYCGIVATSGGRYGAVWECPDLFPLDGKWALLFSPIGMGNRKSVCLIGDMDFDAPAFRVEADNEIDWGFDYYAAQSLLDGEGRRVLMAWQNSWDWMPWHRGHGPTEAERWRCCMALPRRLSLDGKNRLVSTPATEFETLRGQAEEARDLRVGSGRRLLPTPDPVHFELLLEIDLRETTARELRLALRSGGGRETLVTLDFAGGRLVFDRGDADDYAPEKRATQRRECPLSLDPEDDVCVLRVFSDTVSIEIFTAGGRTCMSNTIYPTAAAQRNYAEAVGGEVCVRRYTAWAMAM